MASYYTVVRFVPSAIAEELVNVGVLTWGDGRVRARFLKNWARVDAFARRDSQRHVRDFQKWAESSAQLDAREDGRPLLDEEKLLHMIHDWHGSVQFSEPRASLSTPDDLLAEIATDFLVDVKPMRGA